MTRRRLIPRDYPAGYFTQPVTRPSAANPDGWPPRFVAQASSVLVDLRHGSAASARASARREICVENGTGWRDGTIPDLSKTHTTPAKRPTWMGKKE